MQTPPVDVAPTPEPQARTISYGENEGQFLERYAPSSALSDSGGVLTLTISQRDFDDLQAILRDYRARRPAQYAFEYRNRMEAEQVLGRLDYVKGEIYELAQAHTAPPRLVTTSGAYPGSFNVSIDLGFTPNENGGTVEIELSRFHADRLEDLRDDYRDAEANPITSTLAVCAPHFWAHHYEFPNLDTTRIQKGDYVSSGYSHSCHTAHQRRGRHGVRFSDGKYGVGTIGHIATTTITRTTAVVQMVEYRTTTSVRAHNDLSGGINHQQVCSGGFCRFRFGENHFHTVTVAELRPSHSCLTEDNCVEQGYNTLLEVVHEGHTLILLSGSSSIEITNTLFSHDGYGVFSRPVDPDDDPGIPRSLTATANFGFVVGDTTLYLYVGNSPYPTEYTATTLSALPEALFVPPPKPKHYYTLETRDDDAWATNGGFAFNMRGIMASGNVRAGNFLFSSDAPAHNAHLEYRATPLTLGGFGFYADTGFKWENEGETQAHYGKAMAVYPLFGESGDDADTDADDGRAAWELYASAAVGKVHSDYYEDSRLYGFAAGVFARRVFGANDEWHIRVRRPLSAREIRPLLFGADVRLGDENSRWRLGFDRDLEDGESSAQAGWRFEF
ncbi:MAG: hypothetical protein ACR2QC_03920 [Gammaproteobacteria bacterium]